MSSENCWRCRHNTASNMCEVMDGDATSDPLIDRTAVWITNNVDDMMPPRETPTPCPGFAPVAEVSGV